MAVETRAYVISLSHESLCGMTANFQKAPFVRFCHYTPNIRTNCDKVLEFYWNCYLLPCIEHKELFIDPLRRHVRMRGHTVCLTPKEFDLLYLLANSPGVVFSKEQIYSHIWKADGYLGISTVSDHISSLRQKLGLHPKNKEYIPFFSA